MDKMKLLNEVFNYEETLRRLNTLNEDDLLEELKENPHLIRSVKSPSNDLINKLLEHDLTNISFVLDFFNIEQSEDLLNLDAIVIKALMYINWIQDEELNILLKHDSKEVRQMALKNKLKK